MSAAEREQPRHTYTPSQVLAEPIPAAGGADRGGPGYSGGSGDVGSDRRERGVADDIGAALPGAARRGCCTRREARAGARRKARAGAWSEKRGLERGLAQRAWSERGSCWYARRVGSSAPTWRTLRPACWLGPAIRTGCWTRASGSSIATRAANCLQGCGKSASRAAGVALAFLRGGTHAGC